MIRIPRAYWIFAAVVVLLFGATVTSSWLSPKRGVERAWTKLLSAVEDNDVDGFSELVDERYQDRAGLNKRELVTAVQVARRQFFICEIKDDRRAVTFAGENRRASVKGVIKIDGTGTAVAQSIIRFTKQSDEAVSTEWIRPSWKPWDWRLIAVDHPQAASTMRRLQREAGALGF